MAIVDATLSGLPGANIFQKIQAAYTTDLPASGGVIDARGFTGNGNQLISGTITLGTGVGSKPCVVLLPAGDFQFTDNSPAPKIRIRGGGIRLVGISQGSRALHAPSTTLRQGYEDNFPLIEMSPDASDIRGPWHNAIEYVELVGRGGLNDGGPAIVIKSGQYCCLKHVTVQLFERPGVFPVQLTHGAMTLVNPPNEPRVTNIGCTFCLVEDTRIFFCSGGIEISGNGNLESSSNANWVHRVVGSSLKGPAFYNHNYAIANALVDCEAEGNTGSSDVLITGVADGMRIDRLYTESDNLVGASPAAVLIDSDSSVRQPGDLTFGTVSAGAGVAAHVSIVNSTLSRTLGGTVDAVRITHSRGAGNPGPRGTTISSCFIKGFTSGVTIQNADVWGTTVLLTQYANTANAVVDSGSFTVIWNHFGTLRLAGPLTFSPSGTWDIGTAAGTKPKDLYLGGDAHVGASAFVQGRCQIVSSANDALEVVHGRLRLTTNGQSIDGVTSTLAVRRMMCLAATPAGEVVLSPDGVDVQWGRPLVSVGAGSFATIGRVGGAGPVTAGQNSWMQVKDHTGATFWVPAWK